MKRFFLLVLAAITVFSLFTACGGNSSEEKKGEAPADNALEVKELTPSEKLFAKYSEIANEQASLSEDIAKKNDMTISGKNARLAIDLTDIGMELNKTGEEITEEEIAAFDSKLTKCEETLNEIKGLLEE